MKESEQNNIFQDWLSQYKALLFKIVRAYAFSEDDQDDLFQEISLQVWRSIPGFKQKSAVSTWVYRVSLNTAIRWIRKEKKHEEGRHSIEGMEHVLQVTGSPEDERLAWLYHEISQLDKIERSLTLLLLDGFSYKEMSEMIGISESNIGVKIHRIKKYLIEKSEKYDYNGV